MQYSRSPEDTSLMLSWSQIISVSEHRCQKENHCTEQSYVMEAPVAYGT